MTASRSTATSTEDEAASGAGEIMLFGVRVVVDSMRKSVSLNDLCQYQQPQDLSFNNNPKEDAGAAGYASADDAVNNSSSGRERKRGVPWTEDEHRLFLLGLHKVGKGDWRGISRNFVKTRTPTQVASHAQKYFLRRSNLSRRRRRSSLFDITTETVAASSMEEEHVARQDIAQKPPPSPSPSPSPSFSLRHQPQAREICDPGQFQPTPAFAMPVGPTTFPVPIQNPSPKETGVDLICPLPLVSMPHTSFASHSSPNTNSIMEPPPSVSLDLSLSPSDRRESLSSRHPPFQLTARYKNGESMISVA